MFPFDVRRYSSECGTTTTLPPTDCAAIIIRNEEETEAVPPCKKQRVELPGPGLRIPTGTARVGATYQVPLPSLPAGWHQQPWFLALSLMPRANPSCPLKPQPLHTAFVENDTLHLPRFWGLANCGPAVEARAVGHDMSADVSFAATLNHVQVTATAAALCSLRGVGGAMLVLPCGFGKTVCALWLAVQLRVKTLVIVHSEALADQWRERINTFMPGAVNGRIQQDTVVVEGCAVVVCMIQSLVKRVYAAEVLASFGFVIVDEAHHVAAPLFSKALGKLPARHVLGLSATPDRADGLGCALEWFMGPVAFRATRQAERVDVHMHTYTTGAQKEVVNRKGDPMCSTMITNLSADGARTVEIKELIGEQIMAQRNIMVLSDRLAHLVTLHAMLVEDYPEVLIMQVVGGTKAAERDRAFELARVILSTYHYASEGIDIPRLDTLVLATPRGTIEQSVGRILRPFANKQSPLVIDVKDPFSMFEGMSWKRHRYYKSQKYTIVFK